MTSRERVIKAINHEEPDRVPVDFGGTDVTGLHEGIYCDIVRHLGLDLLPPKIIDQLMMVARMDPQVAQWMCSDVMCVENYEQRFGMKNADWKIWRTATGNDVLVPGAHNPVYNEKDGNYYIYGSNGEILAYRSPSSIYYDFYAPTEMSDDIEYTDPKAFHDSIPLYSDEDLKIMQTRAKFLYENTEYALAGDFRQGALASIGGLFAGHTVCDWLCLLVTEPEYCAEILQAKAERTVENLKLYIDALGDYIEVLFVSGADFGTQRCELFSPEIFKDLYVPNYKLMNDYIHQNCRAKTFFHSCGSNYNILGHMIDAGVDIFNPVHTNTDNMEPWRLKEKFGDKITFWGGGVETQGVLIHGTPEEVKQQVKERIETFGKGGGFVFTGIHNLQPGIPMANLEAMLEGIKEFGVYKK